MATWQTAALPAEGVWRIGRGDDPLRPPDRGAMDLGDSKAGNRFDSLTGAYGVLYFGTSLEACFGETLNRYRRDPALAFIEDEWEQLNFMRPGSVPADWRTRRTAVRVDIEVDDGYLFLDVEDPRTLAFLSTALAPALFMFDVTDLDVATIRGPDRRVTRLISQWVWQQEDTDGAPLFAGIRYLSRSNTAWECWAVFDDMDIVERERQPILHSTEGLELVQELYGLLVF